MKWAVITFFISLSSSSWALEGNVLKCLGEEEKRFHLNKQMGPTFELNQRLISELVQIPRAKVRDEYEKLICSPKNFSASWKLLELAIKKGKDLFAIPDKVTGMQRSITAGMLDEFQEGAKEVFLNFITAIQAEAPTAGCLREEIPELDRFFFEVKYLQEDVDLKKIFEGKDEKIFNHLKNYRSAFERCRDRLKKKPSSGSTAAPKKR